MANAIPPKIRSVENMVKRTREVAHEIAIVPRRTFQALPTYPRSLSAVVFSLLRLILLSVACLNASCSRAEPKPRMVGGMTGVVYNYSQESIVQVKLNGKTVGTGFDGVKVGDVTGGGGMCCTSMPLGATTAQVTYLTAKGEPVALTAKVERWWPDLASSAIVHVLPGRKAVVSIGPKTFPRADLLNARLKELGLPKEKDFPPDLMDYGPLERADGVK